MLTASDAAKRAVHHVTEMTGRDAQGVVGVARTDDNGWRVTVEIVETHRIPDSADILAVYETEIDSEGDLVSFRRASRYLRGRTGRE
jgi:Gas vesicle synthesis protein GvpO